MDLLEIKDVHEALLETYKELKSILIKNNIPFSACGGTAIGALREKGFIPWDDDIDIVIPEEYYDKFILSINNSDLSLTDQSNKKTTPFEKVFNKKFKIEWTRGESQIFIDVCVGYKKRKLKRKRLIYSIIFDYILHIKGHSYKGIKRSYKNKMIIPWVLIKAIPVTRNWLIKKINKQWKKMPVIEDNSIRFLYYFNHKGHYENIDFAKLKEIKFEDTTIPVPSNFGDVHMKIFGDVMKPPKEPRTTSDHGIKIKR